MEKSYSTQNTPQEVTKLKKPQKVTACYMEMQQFKDSVTIQTVSAITAKYNFEPYHCAIKMEKVLMFTAIVVV
jgi:hypothetical protein